ncbi:alpha/beta fold hydrolase [Antarcticirhabdus aurantiaca]|uniref:Alpha/beta hydrolase n=1 Tax=Antarcticirhabdus aurantiaca TaxID=2606717 RepID=A0ACD4NH27_9HYPH|nr:alpha/beta hydrolase [Antarcticirhabdus aurantiaca]WAJ26105.1 alpha/beta hydrolase [Jeongeuplla avenae]
MSAPFVEIGGGHQLFLSDWGSGLPIVLLAGWGMDSRIWGEVMVGLNARGLRTIAYDRRGHGRSTDPGRVDYEDLADDLAAVLTALDLRGVSLVAHSGAAGEAIRFLLRHGTERTARLVLVGATGPRMMSDRDGWPGLTPEMAGAMRARLAADLPGWIEENIELFAPGRRAALLAWMSGMVQDTSRRILLDFQDAILSSDLRRDAARLKLPVTIIHGDRDASAPIDLTARAYARLIPGAELVVYEGGAHGLMVTHADRLAADIAGRVLT